MGARSYIFFLPSSWEMPSSPPSLFMLVSFLSLAFSQPLARLISRSSFPFSQPLPPHFPLTYRHGRWHIFPLASPSFFFCPVAMVLASPLSLGFPLCLFLQLGFPFLPFLSSQACRHGQAMFPLLIGGGVCVKERDSLPLHNESQASSPLPPPSSFHFSSPLPAFLQMPFTD